MRGPIMCNGRFNGHLVVEWQFGRCRAALIGKGEDGTWWMLCREAGFLTSGWKFATHADAVREVDEYMHQRLVLTNGQTVEVGE